MASMFIYIYMVYIYVVYIRYIRYIWYGGGNSTTAEGFQISGISSLIRASWCEEGHPATKNTIQYPWVDNWLMAIFPLVVELNLVKFRQWFGLAWVCGLGKRLTLA